VHPSWVHEMARVYKLGVHTFYRPRAWGDGSDDPIWGSVPTTNKPGSGSVSDATRSGAGADAQGATADKPSHTAKL